MTPLKAPVGPFDKSFPTSSQKVTDRDLVGLLGMTLYGCAFWCPDIRVEGREAVPSWLTPEQASALHGDSSDTTPPCLEELRLLGVTRVFIPNPGADLPEVQLSLPHLREAVMQVYRRRGAAWTSAISAHHTWTR